MSKNSILKKLFSLIAALFITLAFGVTGYVIIEGWNAFDALYMTVITVASVGYGETHELSHVGRVFTIFLIFIGSGVMVYSVSAVASILVEGELTDVFRRNKMEKLISKLNGHYIVVGADDIGKYIIDEMKKTKNPFVVVDWNPEKVKQLMDSDVLAIEGDATKDSTLTTAGIHRAKGLATTLHSDAENLFVVLTAKNLNPELRTISRAVDEESHSKLQKVGADGVVMPNFIGGLRMASVMLRPTVVTFLDLMLRDKDKTIRVEEIELSSDSNLIGKTLDETGFLENEGATVVAVFDKSSGSYRFNPPKSAHMRADQVIIIMGEVGVIQKMREKS